MARLRTLKAFWASARRTPSVPSSLKMLFMAWTAASLPPCWPEASCRGPAASMISLFRCWTTLLPTIRRSISPMPMGLTPGFLFRAMRRHDKRGYTEAGSTREVHSLRVISAMECARASDSLPKALLQIIRLQRASDMPLGPAPPLVVLAALRMAVESMLVKIACSNLGGGSRETRCCRLTGCAGGCLSFNDETTSGVMFRGADGEVSRTRRAAPTLPAIMSRENPLCAALLDEEGSGSFDWMATHSFTRSSNFPACQRLSRCSRHALSSEGLERFPGFWRRRVPMRWRARRATRSNFPDVFHSTIRRVASATKAFPVFPDGSLNWLGLNATTRE